MIREIYFNELSVSDDMKWSATDLKELGLVYLQLKNMDISTCRISGDVLSNLEMALPSGPTGNNVRMLLRTMFKCPYESPIVEEKQDEYLSHKWTYRDIECYGLALAYIEDSLSYSMNSSEWDSAFLEIKRDTADVIVKNVSRVAHLQKHLDWIELQTEPILVETSLLPEQKPVHLRDDYNGPPVKTTF